MDDKVEEPKNHLKKATSSECRISLGQMTDPLDVPED
jgi:hypothetical protein